MYDSNKQRFELSTNEFAPPWCARWMAFLRAATQDRGANVDAATYLRQWVSENPSFEDVVSMDYWLPMIPPIREDESQNDGQRRFYRMMKSIVTVRTIYLEERGGKPELSYLQTYHFSNRVLSAPDARCSWVVGCLRILSTRWKRMYSRRWLKLEYHNIHESSGYTPAKNPIEIFVK